MERIERVARVSRNTSRAGDVLSGRFMLERTLAEGGMGDVWVARSLDDGVRVAVKICCDTPAAVSAIRAEIEVLRRLDRTDVPRVRDAGSLAGGRLYFVMDLLEGDDLYTLIRRDGPFEPARALRILRRLACILDDIHACGVVHRDIKPGNVFIGPRDRVTLIDFGLACVSQTYVSDGPWTVLGTPEYMAPEQVTGARCGVGPASDRYALASLALELLTGCRAYRTSSLGSLLIAIVEQSPRPPSALGWGSTELDALFAKAMARQPSRRFASATAFVNALAACLGATSGATRQQDPTMAATVSIVGASKRAA